jgi:hypothetical protein
VPSTRENQTRPGAASTCRGEAIAAKSTHNHQYEDKTHGLPFPNSHSLWRDSQYLAVGQRHRNRKIPATEEIPRGHDHRHVLKLPGQGWPIFRRYSLDHRTRTGDTRIWSLAPSRRREGRRPRGLSWSNGLWPATDLRVRVYQSRCHFHHTGCRIGGISDWWRIRLSRRKPGITLSLGSLSCPNSVLSTASVSSPPVSMLILVANSVGTTKAVDSPFARLPILPRLSPIDRPGEFASSTHCYSDPVTGADGPAARQQGLGLSVHRVARAVNLRGVVVRKRP